VVVTAASLARPFAGEPIWLWPSLQLGLLVLPFSPLLGLGSFVPGLLWLTARDWRSLGASRLNWAWLAFLGLMLLSAAWGGNGVQNWLGLANFLPFVWLFAAFSRYLIHWQQWQRLVSLLVAASLPVVLLGLAQLYLGWHGPINLLWIVNFQYQAQGNPPGRMSSVFPYANILASYLALIWPLALGGWFQVWGDRPQRRQRIWGWAVLLVVLLLGLLLSDSRNAWGVVLGTTLAFAWYERWHVLVGLSVALGTATYWAAFGSLGQGWLRQIIPSFLWRRLTDEDYPIRLVATLRPTQWEFAWDLAQLRPWFGWGPRSFGFLYEEQMRFWMGHPHNLPLMLAMEQGFPALLLIYGLVGYIVVRAIARLRQRDLVPRNRRLLLSLVLAFLSSAAFAWVDIPFFDSRLNLINWLLLAGLWGLAQGPQVADQPGADSPEGPWPLPVADLDG
jgi:O-antigen ligase